MRVAIVNDSKTAAEVLRRILATVPEYQLAWTAYSGEEALELCAKDVPDIVLMDLIMPGIGGAETTRRIMQSTPCVILVVTATTVGNRDQVFEAMGHGALDAVNTPTLGTNGDMSGAEPLLQKLRMVSRLVAPKRQRHVVHAHTSKGQHHAAKPVRSSGEIPIVAIGSSTGGPQALAQILSHLPAHFPAAVLIAQHVDEQFAQGLVDWLKHHTAMPVHIAKAGEHIHAGTVYIAGTKDHLIFQESSGKLGYTHEPADTPYRPSVDVLFASLATPHYAPRVGVLLTGMGRDGAEGLLALRRAGALTIAQDAASSIVYGMPKAAARLKAAMEVLPLDQIGLRIAEVILKSPAKGNE